MKNWFKFLVIIFVAFSFAACSGKKGGGRKSKGNPGATESGGGTKPDANKSAVDQNIAQFKLTGKKGDNELFQLNVKHEAESIKLTGEIAENSAVDAIDDDHELSPRAHIQTYEKLGIVAVLFRLSNNAEARLFIFTSLDPNKGTYLLQTEGIKAQWRGKMATLNGIIAELVRSKEISITKAFAYLIQAHLNNRDLSLDELATLLFDVGQPNPDDYDDPTADEANVDDLDEVDVTHGNNEPFFELNPNVTIEFSPMTPAGGYVEVTPSASDRIPPWRAGQQTQEQYLEELYVPAPVDYRNSQEVVLVDQLPQIPPLNAKGSHTWPQCFAAKSWRTWTIFHHEIPARDGKEGKASGFCKNDYCTSRSQECCAPIDGGGFCEILEPAGRYQHVDGDANYRPVTEYPVVQVPELPEIHQGPAIQMGGFGSARLLCAHNRAGAAGSFMSNSYLTHENNKRHLEAVDICIPSKGYASLIQEVAVKHEQAFFGGYFKGMKLWFALDFTTHADEAHRMVTDIDVRNVEVMSERPLVKGLTHSGGRGEFMKTFYFPGNGLNNLTIACEIYRYEHSQNCQ